MTTHDTVQRLIHERAAGRKMDLVGFMDQLLLLAQAVGEIRCVPGDNDRLRFTVANEAPFEVELDHAAGKVRMMCARLAVLSQGAGQPNLYGGSGWIALPPLGESDGVTGSNGNEKKVHVEFNNMPGDAWFGLHCKDGVAEPVHQSEKQRAGMAD